jgi:hypothetical protein
MVFGLRSLAFPASYRMEMVGGSGIISLNMFSRRSSPLAPGMFAIVPLLLLALFPPPGKDLFVATSANYSALVIRIKALSPTVSVDDAQRVAYCAVTTGAELARKWHVVGIASWLPGLQNLYVKLGWRKGGLCFQYSTELLIRLDAFKLQTLEFHWAESQPNTVSENNALVVTARGQPFEKGVLLDSWRCQPHVAWTQVTRDPEYHWKENKSAAALALRSANNEIPEKHR